MFDEVATTYDLSNDLLSFGLARVWRTKFKKAVAPRSGEKILDLAAGTGTSSAALLEPGVQVIASDFSQGMLDEGKKRHPEIDFVFADATALPFKPEEFNATTISFGLRNVVDVNKALGEMLRVLKPGGRIVIVEFSKITVPVIRELYGLYLKAVMPIISKISSKTPEAYSYLAESIAAWPNQKQLAQLLTDAGFVQVGWKNFNLGIVAIHRGTKPGAK